MVCLTLCVTPRRSPYDIVALSSGDLIWSSPSSNVIQRWTLSTGLASTVRSVLKPWLLCALRLPRLLPLSHM